MEKHNIIVIGSGGIAAEQVLRTKLAKLGVAAHVEIVSASEFKEKRHLSEYFRPEPIAITPHIIEEPLLFKPPLTRAQRRANERKHKKGK